jgi:uncharacterized membrane protein
MFVSFVQFQIRKSNFMKKTILFFTLIAAISLPFCTTSKNAAGDKKKVEPKISYATDVSPILQERCTPCHFPNGGKKKYLDTYAAVSENIDEILYRIQLPSDSTRFMPWRSKNEPLNDSLIQVIKMWKSQNMPE